MSDNYPSSSPRRRATSMLVGGLIMLLLVGGGAATILLVNQTRSKPLTPQAQTSDRHALYIPQAALAYVSYNSQADSNTTPNLERIQGVYEAQANWKTASEKAKQSEKDYAAKEAAQCKDQPAVQLLRDTNNLWREHVTYAFVPPPSSTMKLLQTAISQSGVGGYDECIGYKLARYTTVLVIDTTIEPEDKDTLTGQLVARTRDSITLDKAADYQAQPIYKLTLSGFDFFVVMRGKDAIVTMDRDLLYLVLDASKDKNQALDLDQDYQDTVNKLPANRMFTVYENLDKTAAFYKQMSSNGYLSSMDISGTIGLSMVAQDNGIQVDIASAINSHFLDFKQKALPFDNRTLPGKAPADLLGLLASQDLKGLINAAQSSSLSSLLGMSYGDSADFDKAKQQFKTETGLDFDNDVLAWMGGEWMAYATNEGPGKDGGLPQIGGGGAIKLNSDGDKQKAQNFVDKITEYARKQAAAPVDAVATPSGGESQGNPGSKVEVTVSDEDVSGSKFHVVKSVTSIGGSYTSTTEIHYGISGDAFVVASSKAAAEGYGKDNALAGAPIYQASIKHIDQRNGGQLYFNLDLIRQMYEQYEYKNNPDHKASYEQEVQPYIAPLKGMALTNTQTDDRFTNIRLHFYISK